MNEPDLIKQTQWLFFRNQGKKRIPFRLIQEGFFNFHTHKSDKDSNWPQELLDWLQNLEEQNLIKIPQDISLHDRYFKWVVPRYITIIIEQVEKRFDKNKINWCPKLSFITNTSIADDTTEQLVKLNDVLINKPELLNETLTLRERSLQIFGDEKFLSKIVNRDWFKKELTLRDINCYKTELPFASFYFPEAITNSAIILENLDTFDAFLKSNRILVKDEIKSFYKLVIYGGGLRIKDNIKDIHHYHSYLDKILYFGDIDYEGLEIPFSIKQYIGNHYPKIHFSLASEYYLKLSDRKQNQSKDIRILKNEDWLKMLPKELIEITKDLINNHLKIPQENLKKNEVEVIIRRKLKNV